MAALWVFGFHFSEHTGGTAHAVVGEVFNQAAGGVTFFFILSGVALTWSRHPHDTKRKFYQRRVARIYPDYLTAWVLTIPVVIYEGSHFDLHAIGLSLVLLQSWWPSTFVIQAWNGVAWTLSCEAFFYLLFPFIVGRIERLRRPLILVPFLCLPTLVLGIIGTAHYQHGKPPETLIWLQTYFPPVRLCEFLVGVVLGVELQRGALPRIRLWTSGVILVVAYVVLAWGKLNWLTDPVFMPVLALVVVAAAQRDVAGRPTLWSWRPLVLIGERSYAFYLVHELVIRVWAQANHQRTMTSTTDAVFWFLLLLAIAATIGWTIFTFVEVPCERRLRGQRAPRLELDESEQANQRGQPGPPSPPAAAPSPGGEQDLGGEHSPDGDRPLRPGTQVLEE
jgi:peptidoglycan/LPS O-acetylase OafA/YrhL